MTLVVDLGQSGARLRWDGGEHITTRAKRATESSVQTLRDIFTELKTAHPDAVTHDCVSMSLTGFDGDVPDPLEFGLLAQEFFGATQVAVSDDGLAGFMGAMHGENGVNLSIGSGAVAVGGRRGKFSHSDGLGHIFGDEGSGFWLGKHGLERALATRHGREQDPKLLDFLSGAVAEFDALESKTDSHAQSLCISTAKRVLEAAEHNISSAVAIRDRGAEQLSKTVAAAWNRAGGMSNESMTLTLLGGLAKNRGYEEAIRRRVSSLLPQMRLSPPRGNHLDGGLLITQTMKEDYPPLLRWWRAS